MLSINVFSQDYSIKKIQVKSVNADTLTTIKVNCDEFEKLFAEKQFRQKIITDSNTLKAFETVLQDVRFLPDYSGIDVRTKAYFYIKENKASVVLCMDKSNAILVNGRKIAPNKGLVSLMHACMK